MSRKTNTLCVFSHFWSIEPPMQAAVKETVNSEKRSATRKLSTETLMEMEEGRLVILDKK